MRDLVLATLLCLLGSSFAFAQEDTEPSRESSRAQRADPETSDESPRVLTFEEELRLDSAERLGWEGFRGETFDERFPTWRDGPKRFFVAGSFDLGFLYVRPRLHFGYGRPHNSWVGLEANPTIWFDTLGGYGGFRIDYPYVNFRVGARFLRPNSRTHLPIKESYMRNDIGTETEGVGTTYLSAEAELTLTIPVGRRGTILSETSVTYISLVPDDFYVYEDYLRIIAAPPWVWRQRLGYIHGFGRTGMFRLGVIGEVLGSPRRDLVAVRAGFSLRLRPNPRVEVRAEFIPSISLRDQLGVRGGNFGLVGIRYRWATGGVTGTTD